MNRLDPQSTRPADRGDELQAQILVPAKPAYHRSTVALSVFLGLVVVGLVAYMVLSSDSTEGANPGQSSGSEASGGESRNDAEGLPAPIGEVPLGSGVPGPGPEIQIVDADPADAVPEAFGETVRVQSPSRSGTPDLATVDAVSASTIAGLPALRLEFRGGHPDCVSYTPGVEETSTHIIVSLVAWTRSIGAPPGCDAVVAMETSVALAEPVGRRNLIIYDGERSDAQ